ncbi:MAG: translation initiation factor IF-2 subunit alpha [Candidatus Thermoplasmatota archaeon]|nr:translation initiation factor IF-2 subunit alpha [Candidatus Thermoplasmatota archaeon]MCL5730725.1 translation initiation factor IF-2 subunit alpha [Candidatus Thermoplasmatota archaeon]
MNGRKFPEIGDLVVVTIVEVKNFGVKARLEEYPNVEGFIHIAEVATGWVKHIRDYLREGQKTVCKVISINMDRGNVDLSLKRINDHSKREKIAAWKEDQKANKLMEIVARQLNKSVEECESMFGEKLRTKYGTLYAAFQDAAASEEWLPAENAPWKRVFVEVAKQNVSVPYVRIVGYADMYCLESDGIERIIKTLESGQSPGIEITYVGAPRYRILVTEKDYKKAEEIVKKSVQKLTESAKANEVHFEFNRAEQ